MMYKKAEVTKIDLSEDVITGSYECNTQGSSYAGCETAGSQVSFNCNEGNHVSMGQCNTNGQRHAVENQ